MVVAKLTDYTLLRGYVVGFHKSLDLHITNIADPDSTVNRELVREVIINQSGYIRSVMLLISDRTKEESEIVKKANAIEGDLNGVIEKFRQKLGGL